MVNLSDTEFETLVNEGLFSIPERFRKLLKNVAVVWAEEPTSEQLVKLDLRPTQALFGLYEGVPQIARGAGYSALPDKITIFKGAITASCQTMDEVKRQVTETVWHELAHHFGSSEARVRQAQYRRRNKQS